jgi:hypothetical protein
MKRKPIAWGYNWATLSLGDINAGNIVSNETAKYGYESYETLRNDYKENYRSVLSSERAPENKRAANILLILAPRTAGASTLVLPFSNVSLHFTIPRLVPRF